MLFRCIHKHQSCFKTMFLVNYSKEYSTLAVRRLVNLFIYRTATQHDEQWEGATLWSAVSLHPTSGKA